MLHLKKNAPVFNLKVLFQSRKCLSTLFIFKDKINKMLQSNLVHKFNCNICNDIYYGKTKHHFKVRACEHLGITPLTGKKAKRLKKIQYLIVFSLRVILNPLSKSLKKLDSSAERRFWYCVMIHLLIDMLSRSLWNFFHNYLQFRFTILTNCCNSFDNLTI